MSIAEAIAREKQRLAHKNKWVKDFQVSLEVAEALEIIVDTQCVPLGYANAEELRNLLAAEIRSCQARKQIPSVMLRHLFQIVYIQSVDNRRNIQVATNLL